MEKISTQEYVERLISAVLVKAEKTMTNNNIIKIDFRANHQCKPATQADGSSEPGVCRICKKPQ